MFYYKEIFIYILRFNWSKRGRYNFLLLIFLGRKGDDDDDDDDDEVPEAGVEGEDGVASYPSGPRLLGHPGLPHLLPTGVQFLCWQDTAEHSQ